MSVRAPKRAPGDVRSWTRSLMMALRYETRWARGDRIPSDGGRARDALHVAGTLISLAGDQERAFRAFRVLMFQSRRSGQWREALSRIPADGTIVDGIARLVTGYERMAAEGRFDSLDDARGVRLPDVVDTMVRVARAPEAFLEAVRDVWCDHPNRVFSEATLREVAPRLRGVLSARARATPPAGATEGMDVVG